jgi:hypothetical protein
MSINTPPSELRNAHDSTEAMGSPQQPGMQQPSAELLAALAPPPMMPGGKEVKNMLVPAVYRTWSEAGGCLGGVADYFARSRRASPTVYKSPYAGDGGVEEDKKDGRELALDFYNRLREEDRAKIDAIRNGHRLGSDSGMET